jgi:hypothetical protein
VPARDGSRGPEVVSFAREHGLGLDEWQAAALDDFSGTFEGGWTSRANVLVVPRQNGKSEILVARALFGLFVLRKRLTLFSSHQWASSNELFLRMKGVIESNPDLAEQVKHTRLSAAQLGFELESGERILFLTRSRAAARGFSADEIIFDEAHFLSEAAHAALKPSAGGRSAEGQVQVFYAASPVDQARHPDGLVLTRLRKRALDGEEGLALVEYGAGITDDEGRDMLPAVIPAALAVDPEILKRANPGCPKRISLEFLVDEARTLDPASFWVEHGGQGDWPDLDGAVSGIVDLDKWAALRDSDSTPVPPVCIGFDVSPDRRRASIAVAGRRLDGSLHVEVVDNADGVGWLQPRLGQLIEDHDPVSVSCDQAQAMIAEQVWRDAGFQAELLDRGELSQACAAFIDAVEDGEVRHLGDPVLLDAIRGATTSSYGGDGWVFSRRSSRVDISPLYAAVIALRAAATADVGEVAIF